jgi:hypothetical protein
VIAPAVIAAHGERLGSRRILAAITSGAVLLLALAGGATAVRGGIPMGKEAPRRVGLGVDPVNRPAAATQFLKAADPPGKVFHIMAFGGYFIHELWPERHVYIDGRLDIFPPGFLWEYRRVMDTGAGWDRVVAAHGISLAVVDYKDDPRSDRGLRAKLRADPEWVCVFCGDNLVVYAHERPKNEKILARFGSSFDPSLRSLESLDAFLREASPGDIERAAAAYGNMTRVAPEEKAPAMLAGRMLDRLGRSDEAAVHFRRVLDIDPASVETRLFLAGALQRSGAVEEARLELDTWSSSGSGR